MFRYVSAAVVALAVMIAGGPAWADFDSDVDKAYAPYRVALFKSNQKDQAATAAAIAKFLKIWDQDVIGAYAQAPARYDREGDWPAVLMTVRGIALKAEEVTKAGEVGEAHEILEAIRDELDEMRDRNGVRVFSSYVNAYHTEMEHLLVMDITPQSWGDAQAAVIREQLGVLTYLAQDLADHAPSAYMENAEFKGLLDGLMGSLDTLRASLDDGDMAAVAKAAKDLKPPYAKLFLKFG